MKFSLTCVAAILICASSMYAAEPTSAELANWHRWRGPAANGVAPQGDPPVEWNQDKNVRWKIDIPGRGSSTPIVWGDQVFILTAIKTDRAAEPAADEPAADDQENKEAGAEPQPEPQRRRRPGGRGGFRFGGGEPPTHFHQFVVLALDRQTGEVLWQRVANELVPHEGHHGSDNNFASASPTTDGQYLYASFGSRGVFCYDLAGDLQWQRDLGDMRTRASFGEGASPALYGDRLVVNWDHEDDSFIVVLDAKNGETIWKVDRDEPTSWTTPLVVQHEGRAQVIVNAANRVRSYDLANGDVIWECGGQTTNAIPSPVIIGQTAICMTGFRGSAAYAIPLSSSGDLTDTDKVAWHHGRGTPYCPSPLLYGRRLYFNQGNSGTLTCLDAESGEVIYDRQRLPDIDNIYASPVGAAGRVYLTGRDGTTVVIRDAPEFEVLAVNKLDDDIDASAAIVGRQILLRSAEHLYCLEAK